MIPEPGQRVVAVTGAGGFIGGALAKRLLDEGCFVIGVDWKQQEYYEGIKFCSVFKLLDLRTLANCKLATLGCDEVYNLAADMGGMGFIQSNESVLFYNNLMISTNMMEAARANGVKKYFYSSSACVYNESKQDDPDDCSLNESMAWPAAPQDTYGLEKLCTEELCMVYGRDFGIEVRIARFHNIFGERGTWFGGREKVPSAFIRKAITSTKDFEVWGDGTATRSFLHISECVEGVIRLMESDYKQPINLGSDEMISMNDFAKKCMYLTNNELPIRHVDGPEGVRGRNSDNALIEKVLGWRPTMSLDDGLAKTISWIYDEIRLKDHAGKDFTTSEIVEQTTESFEKL